ncbi:MAG: hypothetical protein IH986_14710 [Planctomycetes bacterium]|nr:hypothetical protein [Planctomycetota bacterium]
MKTTPRSLDALLMIPLVLAVVAPAVATMTLGKIYDHPVPEEDGFAFLPG